MPWLYIKAVFAHWIAIVGVLLTLTPFVPDRARKWAEVRMKAEFSLRHLWIVGTVLLSFAFYQAWVDEHHNTEQVISDKSSATAEKEFWKAQSYAKDDALRTMTRLLAQNFNTLSGTQNSLTKLSDKILDIGKPAPRIVHTIDLGPMNSAQSNAKHQEQFVLLVNKTIEPVHMLVKCDQPIVAAGGGIMGSRMTMLNDLWGGQRADGSWGVGTGSGAWGPESPLVVTVYFNDGDMRKCSFNAE
jgi:hypothetical protein